MTMLLTRFAPAPTGALHLGHVVNALYVWGLGRRLGARVLLRIEDHDRQRSRAALEAALLDDLDWLGFEPDVFPTSAFRRGPCAARQSDRQSLYDAHARRLAAQGRLYACTCTRETPRRSRHTRSGCPGGCLEQQRPLVSGTVWRLVTEPAPDGFEDLLLGPVRAAPTAAEAEDVPIRDRLGNWTYQFCVSVDDHEQGIGLVIRGRDLLASTPRQIRIGALCGRLAPARFAHHPLLMKSATQKLSKSDGDTGIRDLRAGGWSPAQVMGEAAFRAGLMDRTMPLAASDTPGLFARFAGASTGGHPAGGEGAILPTSPPYPG